MDIPDMLVLLMIGITFLAVFLAATVPRYKEGHMRKVEKLKRKGVKKNKRKKKGKFATLKLKKEGEDLND